MNTIKKIIKIIMVHLNRCPHCKRKMLKGLGGKSEALDNEFTVCPFKHFALEKDEYDLIHVYDGGGKPLPIRKMNNYTGKYSEKKTLY